MLNTCVITSHSPPVPILSCGCATRLNQVSPFSSDELRPSNCTGADFRGWRGVAGVALPQANANTLLCSLSCSLDKGAFGSVAVRGKEREPLRKQTNSAAHCIPGVLTPITFNLRGKPGPGLSWADKEDSEETHAARDGFGDSVADKGSSEPGLNQHSCIMLPNPSLGLVSVRVLGDSSAHTDGDFSLLVNVHLY